ncbi:MAG: hypothetical protein ACOC0P_01965 [Planctomycetota bacterium]
MSSHRRTVRGHAWWGNLPPLTCGRAAGYRGELSDRPRQQLATTSEERRDGERTNESFSSLNIRRHLGERTFTTMLQSMQGVVRREAAGIEPQGERIVWLVRQ